MGRYYSSEKEYSSILQEVHEAVLAKMKRNTDQANAKELQSILQDIKITARTLNEAEPSPSIIALREQYEELVTQAFLFQQASGAHSKGLLGSTLFYRGKKTKTIAEADNIFEEDLAAILAAGEYLSGNKNVQMSDFLIGGTVSGTRATHMELKDIVDAQEILQKLAEKEGKRVSTNIQDAYVKIDVNGEAINLNSYKNVNTNIERLRQLMKDATFSAKSYSSYSYGEVFSQIGLHLGNSNLFKAITGALSEIQFSTKDQIAFFYRGANTILHNSHGNAEATIQHFSHLRFIYELRGSGLLTPDGKVSHVKYMIYNDPNSDAIFVRDTASIILEILNKNLRGNNLLGEVSISASKIRS